MTRLSSRLPGLSVRAAKTIAAPVAAVVAAWTQPRRRKHWLVGVTLTVRERIGLSALRLTCDDDATDIEVRIAARGRAGSRVAIHHTKLPNAQVVAERRHCWKEMLHGLKRYLERPP